MGALAIMLAILALAVIMFLRARDSEVGTSRDDSPAAEFGVKPNRE